MQGMRVQEVVMCIHRFLDELGVDEVRQRGAADDKPLRMVKTLVHELCKCLVRCPGLSPGWTGLPQSTAPERSAERGATPGERAGNQDQGIHDGHPLRPGAATHPGGLRGPEPEDPHGHGHHICLRNQHV